MIESMPSRKARAAADSADTRRRPYHSPLRRQQAARTREDIVAAGARIAHRLASWDWRALTFKAVAEQAGISVRTVHRHFSDERTLRGAILQRLVEESGVRLDHIELRDFASIATDVHRYLSSFATPAPAAEEPALAALDHRRRGALTSAVERAAPDWPSRDCVIAAAMLDMLWTPPLYERLGTAWRLDTAETSAALAWIAGLIEDAIRTNRRPGAARQESGR